MKKVLYLAAMLSLILFGFSCTKPGGNRADSQTPGNNSGNEGNENGNGGTPEYTRPEIKTGAENLVLWLSFNDDKIVDKGEGVTLGENKGQAGLGKGFIGQAWTNKGGDNTIEAYTKLNLASGNALTKMDSFTFAVWAKLPKGKEAKCGIISFNGTGVEATWPSFVFLFDNISDVTPDEGEPFKAQQFNGRIDFLSVEGKPAMWPNCASDVYMKKDEWFHIARTYDATTGHWANYANGQIVNEGDFLPGEKVVGSVSAAFADDCNALYVGGWASRIEGKASDTWQTYCPGSLDELRFYNKAFTADEVLALYGEEIAINLEEEE
ncbi:MAG: LamG domain-containing protein [Bacteroidales bacterium]|nr:LamG domain-containing protein [Bacteroidales bacterium]